MKTNFSKNRKRLSQSTAAFVLTLSILLTASCKQSNIEITGTVKGADSGMVYLRKFYNKMFFTIDSGKIVNGKFSFSKDVPVPEVYGITLDTTQYPFFLFLDKGEKVQVELFANNPDSINVSGSAGNDLYRSYRNATGEVKIDSFIRKNPRSIVSAYLLYREYSYRLTPEEIESNMSLLDTSFRNSQYLNVLRELVTTLRRVEPGNKAIDFELPDTAGNNVKLSSQFGKTLLLDFWASWCPPCRAENPNLVKIYNKYKDQNFTIFSVSLDKKKEDWMKGIHDDQLTWTHVSDLQFWNSSAAKLYGVRAIPSNVLIDKDGTILARNVMGEELEKKLEELMKK
ncbi:MAG TPA: TlpA disulfide reductase family protein [Bacteroidales bacterium]|nr:TlpA disulfide reductase family protein [Bacteroidales bacterium]